KKSNPLCAANRNSYSAEAAREKSEAVIENRRAGANTQSKVRKVINTSSNLDTSICSLHPCRQRSLVDLHAFARTVAPAAHRHPRRRDGDDDPHVRNEGGG